MSNQPEWLTDEVRWSAQVMFDIGYIKTEDDWIEFSDALSEFAQHYLEEVAE